MPEVMCIRWVWFLYELLAGRTPFESDELFSAGLSGVQKIIREKDPPRPSLRYDSLHGTSQEMSAEVAKSRSIDPKTLGKRLRGDLDWIVMKCLEKPRVRRYETADALRSDLARFLANEPVEAGPPGAMYKFQKFAKRRTGLLVSMAAIFMVLVAGVVVSLAFAAEAYEQKNLADQRYEEVKSLAGGMSSNLYAEIYKSDNSIRAREQLVNATLKPLESLQQGTSSDPELQSFIASRYKQLGDIAGGIRGSSRGDQAEARRMYDKAMQIYQKLVQSGHDSTGTVLAMVGVHRALADLDMENGSHEEALKQYQIALDEAKKIASNLPQSDAMYIKAWRNVSSLWRSVSLEQNTLGRVEASRSSWAESMSIRRRLYDISPDQQTERDLALGLSMEGSAQSKSGDLEASLKSYSESLALREKANREWPSDTTRRDLAWANWYMADALRKLQRFKQSQSHYITAIELMIEACNRNPEDARSRGGRGLAGMFAELSKSGYEDVFAGSDALKVCQQALEVNGLKSQTRDELNALITRLSASS